MMFEKKLGAINKICMLIMLVSVVLSVCSINASARTIKFKKITITEGKTYNLKNSKKYSFSSSKSKIASVTKKGVIKAKKRGPCVIKVKKKGKVFRKYKIKVVCDSIKQPTQNNDAVNQVIYATPQPTSMVLPTPNAQFEFFNHGTVSSIKKLDDVNYECVIDFDESAAQKLKDYFKDCFSIKHIICKSSKYREINSGVTIVVEKNKCVYNVIDDSTIELIEYYAFN